MEYIRTLSIRSSAVKGQTLATQALWIIGFAFLTALGAQVQIPHEPVPYTLQTFFILLSGAILGKRNGALSQLLYLFVGAAGIPVFTAWGSGLARILGPTGGYLMSFPVAAFVTGYLVQQHKNFFWILISMILGLVIVFGLGTLYLNLTYLHNWKQSIAGGFLIFSWWDGLKLVAAASIYQQIAKYRTSL